MIDVSNLQQRFADLTQNPETVTYGVRVSATGDDGADTFTNYTLNLAQRREANREDMIGLTLAVSDEVLVWAILQSDLDEAGAPTPLGSYQLTDCAGITWIVEKVKGRYFNAKYECVCRKARG